ncbi:hypothetical protein KR018_003416, partial [Drosophila ironensis]
IKMILRLLVSVVFQFVCASEAGPFQVIQRLNEVYQTELNVFINFDNFESSENIYKILDTPMLQITTKLGQLTDLRISGNLTERALVIVYLPETNLNGLVASLLPNLLDSLHELHIIFLSQEMPPIPWQVDLFTYCYQEGFINAILLHNRNIYSYQPYPSVKPIKLTNINEYFDRGSALKNFHGLPIRTLRLYVSSRDFTYINQRNKTIRTGFNYLALKEFTERYNGTLVSQPVPAVPELQVYEDIFEMLQRKEIDIVAYPKDLDWPVQCTAPLSIINMYFIVPNARPISSYFYYYKPFRWTLWLVVLSTIIYGTFMLYFVSRRDRKELGECLLYCLSHILYTYNRTIRISEWRGALVHSILIIGGFILTNLYLATLSSILTSGLYEPQFTTLEDLDRSPYPSLHDSFYEEQIKYNTLLPENVRQKATSLNSFLLEKYRSGLNDSYMYALYEDRIDLILRQQYLLRTPRFIVVRQAINIALEAHVVSRSLPYLQLANEFMHRLQEHGIFIKMKADSFQSLLDAGIYTLLREVEPPTKPFDLEFYFFAFLIWSVGLGMSLIVFLLEVVNCRN